jgi:hypothetical protein
MLKKAAFAVVLILISGCKNPFSPDHPSLKDLLAAPEEITIDGRSLTLETYLWRDLMPGAGQKGLLALIRVTAIDRQPFPSGVDADRIWVVYEGAIWETELSEPNMDTPYQLAKMARGGPEWGPSVYVDVIVRIVHINGNRYLLRASHQFIGAAY